MFVKKVFCEKHRRIFFGYETYFILTRIYVRLFVKKVFCEKHRRIFFGYETYFSTYSDICQVVCEKSFVKNTGSFLDMKHILVLTRIYDRLFVKKVFCEKHRIFFGYETYFSTYSDICQVVCEKSVL